MLVEGTWREEGTIDTDEEGEFVRQETSFRDQVGKNQTAQHPVESGRYHLIVSYACPWAHRTLIGRSLLGLEEAISVDVVDPIRHNDGWEFDPTKPKCTENTVTETGYLRDVYIEADPHYTGRVTVPVLWDREAETIVNNESIEILRQFDTTFALTVGNGRTLYPSEHAAAIDETIDAIYDPINNGVYKAGFAESQEAYERAVDGLFAALDQWDHHLEDNRYLVGNRLTEADICLFTTLIRFDPVYHIHFKCSRRRIADYPNLFDYLKELYQVPEIRTTCHLDHIRDHYYRSHEDINPSGLVATTPDIELDGPHNRDQLGGDPPIASITETS